LTPGDAGFPVVAVGASAGGLEAFRGLLAGLPLKSGMAFTLVQHLDPTHASMMVNLLAPRTAIDLVEAREDMRIEPDHIYVIPSGRYLAVAGGAFRLTRPHAGQGVRMPLDFLLRSLAAEYGERAVCVILSGTGTDGTAGASAIKESGGLVIAQDPQEAEYDGMPRAAMAAGVVDLVLTLAKLPEALTRYAGHPYVRNGGLADSAGSDGVAKIIDLLRRRTAHDFALYKEGTIRRRIERRMALTGTQDSDGYLERLANDPAEIQHLTEDLFINVTRFFRDFRAFDALADKVISDLVRNQAAGRPIRVWVAGCSTGEEAYSIAMLLLEEIAAQQRNIKLQIFATDIDEDAVTFAREGLYPSSIEADVTAARLARFFSKEDHSYRVSRELRGSIVFSVHDVISNAPFSRLDLISCRNLLIYLRPEVQLKIFSLFHFALRDGGALFLGSSESAGPAGEHFEPISKRQRIYRHIGRSVPTRLDMPMGRGEAARSLWVRPARPALRVHDSIDEVAQRLLLQTYAPASVLVNRKYQGLYYFGPTDPYLKMPAGVASLDLPASAREGLRPAVRAALEKASSGAESAVVVAGRVTRNEHAVAVTVTARPLKSGDDEMILLSFVDVPKPEHAPVAFELPAASSRIAEIEQELDATRKDLEAAIRDRETAEEEIRAINEEAMSVSEEFQTTNEELETSREELQSLNEELTVLNGQLQETLEQNQVFASDLENILNSADLATLFLDEKFNIRFFTPAVKSLFNVIASDIGRPIADLTSHFAQGNLLADARSVLSDLTPVSHEVVTESGSWYACRILPYRSKDNRIGGVVITFVDITERKKAEEAVNAAKLSAETANLGKSRFLAAASHDLRQPLQTLSFLQEILLRKIKESAARELIVRSQEALTAMSGMLNTLLDINQLEAGVVKPKIVDFPIDDLLRRLETEFAYHAQAHALELRVRPCRLSVRSDPRLLEQMIRNLLSNAVKYTPKGGVLLGCRRRGSRLRIEIWDTGAGIAPAKFREIFKEFHQIDNPGQERNRGLGLGLAIVQRLGEMLSHPVNVRSRVNSGSVFTIDVPLAPRGKAVAPARAGRKQAKLPARQGAILIVEDDSGVRDALETLLRSAGHRTTSVEDGEGALAAVVRENVEVDIVIADYNLPSELTGTQVVTLLRNLLGRDLPALILTGDISTSTLGEIAGLGYVHRSKPIKAGDLKRVVQELLAEVTPQPGSPATEPAG